MLKVVEIPNLLESYKEQHELLEQVQKGLNDYLEVKRLFFPRFFFLSNDELLEILSQTKDPRAVQPHLNKSFEGLTKVHFDPKNLDITAMQSSEGEVVQFLQPVRPNEGAKKGNVELWMVEVEDMMRLSVRHVMHLAIQDYAKQERTVLTRREK